MTPCSLLFLVACWFVSAPHSLAAEPGYVVGTWNVPFVKSLWARLWGQSQLTLKQDKEKSSSGWYDPNVNGGRMLDVRMNHEFRFLRSINL